MKKKLDNWFNGNVDPFYLRGYLSKYAVSRRCAVIQDQEECEHSLSDLGWSCKNIMTWPSQDLDFVIKNNDFLIILIWYVINFPEFHINTHGSAQQCQSIKFTLTQADAGREWAGERLTWSKVTTEPADQAITGPGPGTLLCSLRSCSTTVIPIYKMSWAGILSCRLDTSGTSWSRSFSILASKIFRISLWKSNHGAYAFTKKVIT